MRETPACNVKIRFFLLNAISFRNYQIDENITATLRKNRERRDSTPHPPFFAGSLDKPLNQFFEGTTPLKHDPEVWEKL